VIWNTDIGVAGAQTRQIATLARSVGAPKAGIVLGDLNSSPQDSALRPMWAQWKEADPSCKPTGGCKPSHDVQNKKDYIFIRGLRASSVRTIPTAVSDHHAVIATIPI
jgi:endonuclease/exonuclease/phosphatase (EEP) superfamily protein YafD